jgi:hypothetical protein
MPRLQVLNKRKAIARRDCFLAKACLASRQSWYLLPQHYRGDGSSYTIIDLTGFASKHEGLRLDFRKVEFPAFLSQNSEAIHPCCSERSKEFRPFAPLRVI